MNIEISTKSEFPDSKALPEFMVIKLENEENFETVSEMNPILSKDYNSENHNGSLVNIVKEEIETKFTDSNDIEMYATKGEEIDIEENILTKREEEANLVVDGSFDGGISIYNFLCNTNVLQQTMNSTENYFKCSDCDYSANELELLKLHKKSSHSNFKCDHCDFSSTYKRYVIKHMKEHKSDKPIKCNLCNYATHKKKFLLNHMKTHVAQQSFKCNVCSYVATEEADLTKHKKIHGYEGPYKCSRCNYLATKTTDLMRHIVVAHTESQGLCEDSHEILEAAKKAISNFLPTKSREKYLKCYELFCQWRVRRKVEGISENIMLAFFLEKSKTLKASSVWTTYSMLRSTLQIKDKVDISKYQQLIAFLKKQSEGYEPKMSKVLTSEHILKFLSEAPNDSFLFMKVALIFALNGSCRSEELCSLSLDDVEEAESVIIVTLHNAKIRKKRVFTVTSEANGIELYKEYRKLRPKNVSHRRLFVCYRNGKCRAQPVGIATFYGMPKKIAEFLRLPEANRYTGHCMRRTSATLLIDKGGSNSD